MLWGPPGTGAPDGGRRGLGRAQRSGSVGVGHEISWLAWRGCVLGVGVGVWGVSTVRGCRRPWKRV